MKKVVFLILHYLTIEDTIKCVDSINIKCKDKNYEILIVDNGSKNNTGLELQKKYKTNEKITILLSDKNLGFASGNNLGFKYAKENMNPDFIVMINNDIIMLQEDFIDKIIEEYDNSHFAVLGPKIILNGHEFNYPDQIPTLKELKKIRFKTKRLYYFNKIYLRYIISIIIRIEKILKKEKKYNINIRKEDVLLNGCCLIFSRKYINLFNGLDSRTFLYYEEQLLLLRVRNNNLKIVYNPKLEIYHNEGVSTNKSIKNKRKRFDFKLKNELDSLNILINEMEKSK